jgi:hypothetical protein
VGREGRGVPSGEVTRALQSLIFVPVHWVGRVEEEG